MVTEPEAAAIFTVRYMQEEGLTNLKNNQCFILCDAGGGTVDVVGYKVKQLTPSLELEEMTIPTGMNSHHHSRRLITNSAVGGKCGSSFINIDFKKWLQKPEVLGDHYKMLDSRSDGEMVNAHATEAGAVGEAQ